MTERLAAPLALVLAMGCGESPRPDRDLPPPASIGAAQILGRWEVLSTAVARGAPVRPETPTSWVFHEGGRLTVEGPRAVEGRYRLEAGRLVVEAQGLTLAYQAHAVGVRELELRADLPLDELEVAATLRLSR